jgi:3'-phosphoadenosine 5'-phosphosulfate synthase
MPIDFTGIDSPYEAPKNPDIIIDTVNNSVDKCVDTILDYLRLKVFILEMFHLKLNFVS